jgi:hypothetical protein
MKMNWWKSPGASSISGSVKMLFLCGLAVLITGCGGSSSNVPQSSTVMVTFNGPTPSAVATRIGNGAFTRASLTGNVLSFSLPAGATNYTVAYVCPPPSPFFTPSISESVIEASIQDGTAFTGDCPSLGLVSSVKATGTVDARAISGATQVRILGKGALLPIFLGPPLGVFTSFSVDLFPGTQDVAVLAEDATGRIVAIKVLPAQSVPGPLNGGTTILFGAADATTMQSFTTTNSPAGFLSNQSVEYQTANGTIFPLTFQSVNQSASYAIVPAAATQNGDVYVFGANASNSSQTLGISQQTNNGSGPVTLAYPGPWTFAGPAPAAFPTFTFSYSGFPAGLSTVAQQASVLWSTASSTRNSISLLATANFQNGTTTLTIPDLTSIGGFLSPPASGTTVNWSAFINASTVQELSLFATPPPNVSTALVQTSGSYTEP